MRFRKLRIAWSVACGIVCLLLIVLWVRSYWWADYIDIPVTTNKTTILALVPGGVGIQHRVNPKMLWPTTPWKLVTRPPQDDWKVHSRLGFFYEHNSQRTTIECAYLVMLVGIAATGAASWLPWPKRFSLRTLLVATTVVAVVLGLIVAVSR